jgi:hypothetical protein
LSSVCKFFHQFSEAQFFKSLKDVSLLALSILEALPVKISNSKA